MTPRTRRAMCGVAILVVLSATLSTAIKGQALHSVVEPRARLFPTVGPGVTALKHDSAGRYYVLGKPATAVSIYGADGNLIGQIPNANSLGTTIRYAVDFDLSPDGLVAIADRGSNAVEIFRADGSVVSKIHVLAPTSVVALSGDEVAVTSLTSERLVQILDEKGNVVRSFGDPANVKDFAPDDREKKPLVDWGKIVGDSAGDIYFSFTSLPDPLLRKYDRYGYANYEASVPKDFFKTPQTSSQDRVEFTMNFTHLSFSDQTTGSFTIGSSGDVKFAGGMGTGLGRILGSGGSFGRAAAQAGLLQGATGSTVGGLPGGPGSLGGMFSGEITSQGGQFQFGAGNMSSMRGGRGRSALNTTFDQQAPLGQTLQFFRSGNDNSSGTDQYSQVLSFSATDLATQPPTDGGNYAGIDVTQNSALPAAFAYANLFNSVGFQPPGAGGLGRFPGGMHGPGGFRGMGDARPGGAGPFGDGQFRPHGRFGAGEADVVATVRVNLGDIGKNSVDKPLITATAVDPSTGELWATAGDALIHFSKDGNAVEVYYLTLKGGVAVKPTALLVEAHRFLVAADPWGIFEFDRTH